MSVQGATFLAQPVRFTRSGWPVESKVHLFADGLPAMSDHDAFKAAHFKGVDRLSVKRGEVAAAIHSAAQRIAWAYGLRGVCDPMYIANVIAKELHFGDGNGNFMGSEGES